jgi:hypothetical protein
MMRRDVSDIVASQERIGWEWEDLEFWRYPPKFHEQTIADTKYRYWDEVQRSMVWHPFEVEYESLEWHPMWIEKERRVGFKPEQTD